MPDTVIRQMTIKLIECETGSLGVEISEMTPEIREPVAISFWGSKAKVMKEYEAMQKAVLQLIGN